jgi:thiamine-monophosphate kinase
VSRTNQASAGGELEALELIRTRLPAAPNGEIWIGDDAAVVPAGEGSVLLTTDTVVEGVHGDLANGLVSLCDFGWRAVAAAVSDIAAMGGAPERLLVSVAAPPDTDLAALYEGIADAAARTGSDVIGGDLSTGPVVTVTVTVTGRLGPGERPVLRSGATAGEFLVVTGPLGAAAAGLRLLRGGDTTQSAGATTSAVVGPASDALVSAHRRPVARVGEGRVAASCGASAMIDLSDGIASDVRRIAEASKVGVVLEEIPVAVGATETEALCGGDDYELLFAIGDPEEVLHRFALAGLRQPVVVGRCTEDPGERVLREVALPDCGWEHPWAT